MTAQNFTPSVNPILTKSTDLPDDHLLGTKVDTNFNTATVSGSDTVWIRVKATGALVANKVYLLGFDHVVGALVSSAATSVSRLCVPQQAVIANQWAWVAFKGRMNINSLASNVGGAKQYTSATTGSVDDTAGGQIFIQGLTLITTVVGAGDAAFYAIDELAVGRV